VSNLKRSTRLLIIIPAFNEQGAIKQVVSGVRQAVPQADVLVINDGSEDNTAQEAESAGALVVEHPFNLGIGGAVQTGLKFARDQGYDYVIRLDGDGQHNAEEIQLFLKVLSSECADMVVGSRFLDSDVDWHIPFARRVGIHFFGWGVSLLIGQRVTDTTSGFCGLNRSAIDVLATYLPQDYPDVESRVIVHKAGLRQIELPVHMRARVAGVSSIDSWKSIYYAFKVSLAMITSALKDIHLQSHSPYINGNSTVNGIYQNGGYQNGHHANRAGSNGKVAGVVANGMVVPAISQHVVTPNGAEVVQPSGVES
jgi:glycosyltransferase involved in cell wall biosynthesis